MQRADMEIQIIHRDKFGIMVAVSVLVVVSPTAQNDFFDGLGFVDSIDIETLEKGKNRYIDSEKINISSLVEEAFDYVKYEGSLTTPPCSERVTWFILNKRIEVFIICDNLIF